MITKCHGIDRQPRRLLSLEELNALCSKLNFIHDSTVTEVRTIIGNKFIVECLRDEFFMLVKCLTKCIDHVNHLMKVLRNRAPNTTFTEIIHERLSIDSTPDVWLQEISLSSTLGKFVRTLQKRLNYFNSSLTAKSTMQLIFDLSNFHNPQKLLLAIKLQYSMDLDIPAMTTEDWVAAVIDMDLSTGGEKTSLEVIEYCLFCVVYCGKVRTFITSNIRFVHEGGGKEEDRVLCTSRVHLHFFVDIARYALQFMVILFVLFLR